MGNNEQPSSNNNGNNTGKINGNNTGNETVSNNSLTDITNAVTPEVTKDLKNNYTTAPWALELIKNALMISMYTTLNTVIYWPTYLYNLPELSIEAILPRKKTCKNLLGDEKMCKKKLKCFFKECNILDDPIIEQIRLLKGNTNDDDNSNVKMSGGGSYNKKMKKLYNSYYNNVKRKIKNTYIELEKIRKKKNKILIKYIDKNYIDKNLIIKNKKNKKYKLLKHKKIKKGGASTENAALFKDDTPSEDDILSEDATQPEVKKSSKLKDKFMKKMKNAKNNYNKGKKKMKNTTNKYSKKAKNVKEKFDKGKKIISNKIDIAKSLPGKAYKDLFISDSKPRNEIEENNKTCCLNPTSYRWCDPYIYPDARSYKSEDGKLLQFINYILDIKNENTEILSVKKLTGRLKDLLTKTIEQKNPPESNQSGGSNTNELTKNKNSIIENNPELKTTLEKILTTDLKPETLFRLIIILKISKIIHDDYEQFWNFEDVNKSNNENSNSKKSKKGCCFSGGNDGETGNSSPNNNADVDKKSAGNNKPHFDVNERRKLQDLQSKYGISIHDFPDYVSWPYPDIELLFDSKQSYSKCLKEMLIGSNEAASSCLECPTCYLGKTASKIWGEVIDEMLSSNISKSKSRVLSSSLNHQIDTIYDTLLNKYSVFNERSDQSYESQKRYLIDKFTIKDKDGFSTFLKQIILLGLCSDDIDIYKLKSGPDYKKSDPFITERSKKSNSHYLEKRKKISQDMVDGMLGIPKIKIDPKVLKSVFTRKDGKTILQNLGKIYHELQPFDILDIVENEYYKKLCHEIISIKNSKRMNESTLKYKIKKIGINNYYFLYGNKKQHPFGKKDIDYDKLMDFVLYAKQYGYSKSLLNKIDNNALFDENRMEFNNMIQRYVLDPPDKYYSKHTTPDDLLVDTTIYLYKDIVDYAEQLSDYLNTDNYETLLQGLNNKKTTIENILDLMNGGDKYDELMKIINDEMRRRVIGNSGKENLEDQLRSILMNNFSIKEHDQFEDLDACLFLRKKLGIDIRDDIPGDHERIITDSKIKNEKKLQIIKSLIDMLKLDKSKINNTE